ncbi:hypothetical protein PCASD_16765 [Puccinia coronata f. sp. avenae]|uniref:Uncharacterized protein n=1 Tax=Puccinia coronata f. sp. avenae TaxID=200324 RepID=A0A2N5TDY8_9BASI|nr:hypothetical protein PCASD_16765 [Puccinia coronata f. sp. avenae]
MIHLSLNDHRSALESFQQSVRRDKSTQPSPLEFMQLGVLLFWLEKYELAYENFSVALLLMDGRSHIQYQNVGLDFCLYASEILFNSAICLLHLGKFDEGIERLGEALAKQEYVDQIPRPLDVISAIGEEDEEGRSGTRARADYWRLFQVPKGTLYRPITTTAVSHQEKNEMVQEKDIRTLPHTYYHHHASGNHLVFLPSISRRSIASSNQTASVSTTPRKYHRNLLKLIFS